MWHFICAISFAALVSATFSPSGYINNVFEILKYRLNENGSVNWAIPPFELELQRSDDNLSISFFRAYFQGLEHIELEDECSMRNLTRVIHIECLAKFPNAIFTAYGNLKEAMHNSVIRVHVTTTNLLFLLRIDTMLADKVTTFEPVSPPISDVTVTPKLIPSSWEAPVKVEISKWSHSRFLNLLDLDIKWLLNEVVSMTPIGNPIMVPPLIEAHV